jgi:hypothetical protein
VFQKKRASRQSFFQDSQEAGKTQARIPTPRISNTFLGIFSSYSTTFFLCPHNRLFLLLNFLFFSLGFHQKSMSDIESIPLFSKEAKEYNKPKRWGSYTRLAAALVLGTVSMCTLAAFRTGTEQNAYQIFETNFFV